MNLVVKIGDITKEDVDCIVNAANCSMIGGGGVDGAIHRAAGEGLNRECLDFPVKAELENDYKVRCNTGETILTKGHNLKAQYILHTVGPNCSGKMFPDWEDEMVLYNCWYNTLVMANGFFFKTISFPSISTGIHNFPIKRASELALKAIRSFDTDFIKTTIEEVRIVCFTKEDYEVYRSTVKGE